MTHETRKAAIRVIVVDDSGFMRRAIAQMLESDERIDVIATASNGKEGVELIRHHKPDVVTMDIEMPVMNGLTALRHVMDEAPTNVIIISSLTQQGSQAALDALSSGAADVLAKDHATFSTEIHGLRRELIAKVVALAHRRPRRRPLDLASTPPPHRPVSPAASYVRPAPDPDQTTIVHRGIPRLPPIDLICVGASTGGPPVLEQIVAVLPSQFPIPIVIAQHMPELFTRSMAKRFNETCRVPVVHAVDGMPIIAGRVYIAPGGRHLKLARSGARAIARGCDEIRGQVYKPSVNVLLESAATLSNTSTLAIILTGMGTDGAAGAASVKDAGGIVLAQDEETCVVYGMPKAVAERGIAAASLPPDQLCQAILTAGSRLRRSA